MSVMDELSDHLEEVDKLVSDIDSREDANSHIVKDGVIPPTLKLRTCCVYEIWADGLPRYVGSSTCVRDRIKAHLNANTAGLRSEFSTWTIKLLRAQSMGMFSMERKRIAELAEAYGTIRNLAHNPRFSTLSCLVSVSCKLRLQELANKANMKHSELLSHIVSRAVTGKDTFGRP